MALKLLQPGGQPLGQFDCLDGDLASFKGGEVCTLTTVLVSSSDQAASDAFDGYISVGPKRTVVTLTLTSSTRPLFLSDDGLTGYGTLFGTVVGGTVGQVSYGANTTVASADKLGPHSAKGSGKMTLWGSPGLYAVTLDSVDTDASNGLTVTNTALTAGTALYYTSAGLLTTLANRVSSGPAVGSFVEFSSNGSLVSTPNHLVGTLSTPDGSLSASARTHSHAVFYWNPPV